MNTSGGNPDRFEAEVAERLRDRGRPDPDQLGALISFAGRLPNRGHSWVTRRFLFAAMAPLLALLVLTAGLVSQSGVASTSSTSPVPSLVAPSALATTMSTVSVTNSPVPSQVASGAPMLPDPSTYAGDARLHWCGGLHNQGTSVLTIFSFAHASDYRERLAALGYSAALEKTDSVLVLVYDGPSPLDLSLGDGRPRTHTPSSGRFDICVGAADWHQRFADVAIDWASLEGTTTPTAGPASPTVLAKLPAGYESSGTNLVWDQTRGVLWYAYVGCGDSSSLYELDPITSKTQQWAIPSNTFGNCQPPTLGLDASGAVWVMESSLLVRFSPDSHAQQSVRLAPDLIDASRTADSRSFPTALAFDGTTALVARINVSALTVVGPDMNLSSVQIPPQTSGATSLAFAGGKIFALAGSRVWVLTRDGGLLASSPTSGASLSVRPDGQVILWLSAGSGRLIAGDGSLTGPVAIPGTLPGNSSWTYFATDWNRRSWYVAPASGYEAIIQLD